MREPDFGSILGGGNGRAQDGRAVFAMVQTLGRKKNLRYFTPDAFDYIVIDEFHHGMADSYRMIINYFQPRFFPGLTYDPRADGRSRRPCPVRLQHRL
jgi:superfamily II DNA or RNA helicase